MAASMLTRRSLFRAVQSARLSSPTSFACRKLQDVYQGHSVTQRRNFNDLLGDKTVRIGCASGFWGDTAVSAPQLVHHGKIDYLVFDYLSEITMSLLAAARRKNPDMGYAPDFVQVIIKHLLHDIKKKGIKVISNAGGINPHACAAAIKQVAKDADIDIKVAVVSGDNLMVDKKAVYATNPTDLDSGNPLPESLVTMNAYFGATPIARALDLGADIVVTGRCVDSAVVLGPLMHTFGWSPEDYNTLAAGSLAGHLVECGAQATGGVFTDWHLVPDWDNIGFPIVQVAPDGKFVLTKPPKTGGLVNKATVGEQLVYEIGDPRAYMLPDVTCDFSQVNLTEVKDENGDGVLVTGVKGYNPSDSYKVSATYLEGYRATAVSTIAGRDAIAKGRRTAESQIKRIRKIFKMFGMQDFTRVRIQMIGSEETYGANARDLNPREAALWLAVEHPQKEALRIFAMELAPAGTGMAPGLTGLIGGRPKTSPILKLHSFLYPKDKVPVKVDVDGTEEDFTVLSNPGTEAGRSSDPEPAPIGDLETGDQTFDVGQLAYTRSGDKANSANIGVIARHPSYLPYLKKALTAQAVQEYFQHVFEPSEEGEELVIRYDLPGLDALNFMLKKSLGGGGVTSLRSDPQGKAYGQMLLDFKIENVPDLLTRAKE
ncbi:uncharacterized protein LOC115918506 [Strongylocentrotus purpuratus]|uniref:Terpene utilization protein AtuA n=1 Tax=Strongylocentrotus purpuratus TaxID=7668 RepID=A0A7M7NK03_STRPU|nr:uncharacterized protein LOC115918506 [Strongylocentrotus purpuratus]